LGGDKFAMETWKVIKRGEYPVVEFTSQEKGIKCDRCGRIVPERYTESFWGTRKDREGLTVVCRNVWSLGYGKIHEACGK
jgi:hypothetical protein